MTRDQRWNVVRLKHLLASIESGVSVNAADVPRSDDELGVLKTSCVAQGVFDSQQNKTVIEEDLRRVSCPVKAGRIIVSRMNTPQLVGAAALVRNDVENIFLPDRLWQVTLTPDADSGFVAYWMQTTAYRDQVTIAGVGTSASMQNLSQADFRDLTLAIPSVDEQRAIAGFLDRETARIDTLIEEQQRLIGLLRERRGNLIRGAVLGDTNPLSAVGTDHLTTIGYHFSVTLGKMLDGGKAPSEGAEYLPYIRAGNLQDHGLQLTDVNSMPFSPREARDLDLRGGDLLVAEGGAVGTNVLLATDMPGWSFQKTVNRVRPLHDWSAAWLGYVLRTYRDLGVIDIICNRSTIAHLTAEKLRAMRIPQCEVEEQRRTVAYLDDQTGKIDALIAATEKFIDLARERRAALITAAVTGQIDVRDEVA